MRNLFLDFPFPKMEGLNPEWDGAKFKLGDRSLPYLQYAAGPSNWTADLTEMHEAEAGDGLHPIDILSRRQATASMQRLLSQPGAYVMDVGCSSGFLLRDWQMLQPAAGILGSDFLAEIVQKTAPQLPGIPFLQFDLRSCPLPDACLDGVVCLNVLEHIDDDAAALHEIFRILKPGGIAHIEVPSGPDLYDIYDEHLMHHRRYRLSSLLEAERSLGFNILHSTHIGFFVYPAFQFVKRRNRRRLSLPPEKKKTIVTQQIRSTGSSSLLSFVFELEFLLKDFSLPLGIRCVTKIQKPL